MIWRTHTRLFYGLALASSAILALPARSQVFTVGEKTATADIDTEFHPTRVELPDGRLTERGRRELVRDFDAEQGFAHRILPLASTVTLHANGTLVPGSEEYKKLIYKKGQSAGVGDRVAVTALDFKPDRILVDLNGGPYPKHRFMRHIQISVGGASTNPNGLNDGQEATGTRIVLLFEGGVPELSAPELKSLLYPLVDFGVKSGAEAYADTLPPMLRQAIATHQVLVGMNRQMVIAAVGAPESKVREHLEGGENVEEWIYGHQPQTIRFVRLTGDKVTLLKIAALGKPMEIHDQDEVAAYLPQPEPRTVAQGDGAGPTKAGAPTLKNPGEVLPDEMPAEMQNKKVQYPVEKKPGEPAAKPEFVAGPV